jgi:uncharacterized protein involved in exopolysaccharide biosynthesis
MRIRVESADPNLAARLANGIAEVYVTNTLEQKRRLAEAALAGLQIRATELTTQIRDAEKELASYGAALANRNDDALDLISARLVEINNQLTQARVDLAEREARLEQVRSFLDAGRGGADAILTSPLLAELQAERVRLERDRTELGLVAISNELNRVLLDLRSKGDVSAICPRSTCASSSGTLRPCGPAIAESSSRSATCSGRWTR